MADDPIIVTHAAQPRFEYPNWLLVGGLRRRVSGLNYIDQF
jgi:hypothetical protein